MTNALHSRSRLAATALAAAAAAASPLAQAATVSVMNTAGNVLMGFDGLQVGTKAYDVRFVDGTCIALFDGCSANTNSFMFTNLADAQAAGNVLQDALIQAGNSQGALNGISNNNAAMMADIYTPYAFPAGSQYFQMLSQQFSSSAANTAAFLTGTISLASESTAWGTVNQDLSNQPYSTYARWTEASVQAPTQNVPEPGSLALAAVGLGAAFLAGGKARRRRPA